MRFRVQGLGFGGWGLGFRDEGLGPMCLVHPRSLRFRALGLGGGGGYGRFGRCWDRTTPPAKHHVHPSVQSPLFSVLNAVPSVSKTLLSVFKTLRVCPRR